MIAVNTVELTEYVNRKLRRRGQRPNKYGAEPVLDDGHRFDSKREHRRYKELKLLLAAGSITTLEVHPRWSLLVNGVKIGAYEGDFRYFSFERDCEVVEDAKGFRTPAYKLKRKLMKALYGIEVVEV